MDFSGIEKLSLVDFDHRVACILFSNGCNFRCPFCHNSDLVFSNNIVSIPFDEILAYLTKRKGILDGVVISGGAPTLMPDLVDKIKAIKATTAIPAITLLKILLALSYHVTRSRNKKRKIMYPTKDTTAIAAAIKYNFNVSIYNAHYFIRVRYFCQILINIFRFTVFLSLYILTNFL